MLDHITIVVFYSLNNSPCVTLVTGDRAHVIERKRNTRTGEEEENQELVNLDESKYIDIESQDSMHEPFCYVSQEQERRKLVNLDESKYTIKEIREKVLLLYLYSVSLPSLQ